MTLNDLKGQRSAYYEEFVGIGQKADSEGRSLTEAEQERCDKLDNMVSDLDVKIKHKQREQEMVARMAQSGNVSNPKSAKLSAYTVRFLSAEQLHRLPTAATWKAQKLNGSRKPPRKHVRRACSSLDRLQFLLWLCVLWATLTNTALPQAQVLVQLLL
jgi:hypothetical protein